MTIADILNSYEEVKDDLKFHSNSSVQTKIIISLNDGPKNIKDLQKLTRTHSSIILCCILELEKEDLVSNREDYYYLSKIGKEISFKLVDMVKTLIVLKNSQKILLNHEIESIPPHLLKEIGDLSNSKLIESTNTDVGKIHDTHIQVVLNAQKIKGVSPIFYSDYIENFSKVLKKGVNVELILTEAVLRKTIESHDPEKLEDLKRLIRKNQLKLYEIKEEVKVAFTVTDKTMTFGLFTINGMHDPTKNLISNHEDALAWGNRLFEYYLKRAQKVDLDYFKGY